MKYSRRRKPATEHKIRQVAEEIYQIRLLLNQPGSEQSDWAKAVKIVHSPVRTARFACSRLLLKFRLRIVNTLGLPYPKLLPLVCFGIFLTLLIVLVRGLPPIVEVWGRWEQKWIWSLLIITLFICAVIWSETQKDGAEPLDSIDDLVRILVDKVEAIAILLAATLFILESPDRQEDNQYNAWQVIDNAADIETSYPRKKALEELNNAQVPMRGIDLPGADLRDIDLSDAELIQANLSRADLSRALLRNADLSNVNLSDAILESTNLSHALLSNALLSNAILYGAELSHADLVFADLSNADLTTADLSGAFLDKANLTNANLHYANLSDAFLSKAFLDGANFSNANLSGVVLSGSALNNADFSNADLSDAVFFRAFLNGADLNGADLSGTFLEEADLDNIQWNENTQWPSPEDVAKANNIPYALKRQLGIK